MPEATLHPLLRVERLTTQFETSSGPVRVVEEASLTVHAGQTVGVVGESGSGKSLTMLSILGLLPRGARVVSGHAWLEGRDLLTLSERELKHVRGREIGLVFQDPMTALNPVMSVGAQISESLRRHSPQLGRRDRHRRVIALLDQVRVPRAAVRAKQYPHEYSGGMRQRAVIAMAMANGPRLLLADEPTTALDVTVQAQILTLLQQLQDETGMALVLISHDLGVIAETARQTVVMYAGRVVESGASADVFARPQHPYTQRLLASRPTLSDTRGHDLPAIPGQPPTAGHLPEGCAFEPRCFVGAGRPECRSRPELVLVGDGHRAACHFHAELSATERSGT